MGKEVKAVKYGQIKCYLDRFERCRKAKEKRPWDLELFLTYVSGMSKGRVYYVAKKYIRERKTDIEGAIKTINEVFNLNIPVTGDLFEEGGK